MTNATKKFFYLAVLALIVCMTVSLRGVSHASAQEAAPQKAPAKAPAGPAIDAEPSGVVYLSKISLTTAYKDNADRSYRVLINHRDTPGVVEVHTENADIFYIIDGSATFVTGGTIVNPIKSSATEPRGESMEGGVSHTLTKGDVIMVPKNVTHWFKEIQQPITYFAVKVR